MKYLKSNLRKMKKAQLLDMYREEFPFKSQWMLSSYTKDDIIRKLVEVSD